MTHLAGRVLHFTLSAAEKAEAWRGDPKELVRLISLSLYDDEAALRCASP